MTARARLIALLVLVFTLQSVIGAGQSGPASVRLHDAPGYGAQSDPIIRGGIDLVTVDFTAIGSDGKLVGDLTLDQIKIKVNGRERPIKSFQFVQTASPVAPAGSTAPHRELPPPFGTNYVGDSGRTIVLVVENESLRPAIARHTTDAAAKFVAGLSPRDRVALVTTPRGGLQTDLTRDHARVQQLLANIAGQGSPRDTESAKACRTRETLMALRALLDGLVGFDLPKTVVFISAGILTARRDAPLNGPPGACEIRAVHYDDVGKAAVDARANFFVIKSDDLVIDSASNAFTDPAASRFRSSDEELAGLESLAGVTSGQLLRMNPSDHSAFGRVARETSGYYLMAFDPDESERNGLSHRVDVEVARPNVSVRVRPRLDDPQDIRESGGTVSHAARDAPRRPAVPRPAAASRGVHVGQPGRHQVEGRGARGAARSDGHDYVGCVRADHHRPESSSRNGSRTSASWRGSRSFPPASRLPARTACAWPRSTTWADAARPTTSSRRS